MSTLTIDTETVELLPLELGDEIENWANRVGLGWAKTIDVDPTTGQATAAVVMVKNWAARPVRDHANERVLVDRVPVPADTEPFPRQPLVAIVARLG